MEHIQCGLLKKLFQKAEELRETGRKGDACILCISWLQGSTLTGNYELRIDLYDREFYLDEEECCIYWNPDFITDYLEKDIAYFKQAARGRIPQVKTYEIQEFVDGYRLNYVYLLLRFFQQMLPHVLTEADAALKAYLPEGFKVVFGEYMGKGVLVWEK